MTYGYVILTTTQRGIYTGETLEYKIAFRLDTIVRFTDYAVIVRTGEYNGTETIRVNEPFDEILEAVKKAQAAVVSYIPPYPTV